MKKYQKIGYAWSIIGIVLAAVAVFYDPMENNLLLLYVGWLAGACAIWIYTGGFKGSEKDPPEDP